jgi:hypothetical protein
MKKSKLKYRLTTYKNEQEVVRDLDLKVIGVPDRLLNPALLSKAFIPIDFHKSL